MDLSIHYFHTLALLCLFMLGPLNQFGGRGELAGPWFEIRCPKRKLDKGPWLPLLLPSMLVGRLGCSLGIGWPEDQPMSNFAYLYREILSCILLPLAWPQCQFIVRAPLNDNSHNKWNFNRRPIEYKQKQWCNKVVFVDKEEKSREKT